MSTASMSTADDQTSEQKMETVVRFYETRARRVLANGEVKEYTIQNRYVPKKKAGPCKTDINKEYAKRRSMIKAYMRNLSLGQLKQVEELCELLNCTPRVSDY